MEYFRRLGRFWGPEGAAVAWLFLALPALHFLQTTVHEGTHAMAAVVSTGGSPKLVTYAHSSAAGFRNGATIPDAKSTVSPVERKECNSRKRSSDPPRLAGFSALPQFVALAQIALFSVVFIVTTLEGPRVRFALRAWYLAACLDFLYSTIRGLIGGCNKFADWSKFMLRSDIPVAGFVVMTWVFWLLVLAHFVWVYWSPWSRPPASRPGFWGYRWIALILGILSFLAVLLSFAVGDPSIDKGSVAFILPLVIQILALIWYWLYFGLTFKYQS
jgi:hypothetical protein